MTMASSNRFQHLFSTPNPKNPTLLELLDPLNQIKYKKPDTFGFMEIFGEIYFDERSVSDLNLQGSSNEKLNNKSYGDNVGSNWDFSEGANKGKFRFGSTHNYGFSENSSEIFPNCNEGLGFESYSMFETTKNNREDDCRYVEKVKVHNVTKSIEKMEINGRFKRSRRGKGFPPLISCIGSNGNPRFWLKSFRNDGRLIVKVIRTPPQELLYASDQEDGTLSFSFFKPGEDIDDENEVEHREDNDGGKEKAVDAEDKAEIGDHDEN